jgi:anti-sigma regulatory factor (Ser/Thr protein kinase)
MSPTTHSRPSPNIIRHRISVPASYAGLKDLFDECSRFAERHQIGDGTKHDMYVAVEELASNVIRHGRRPGIRPRITVAVALTGNELCVTVADNAPAFNPLTVPPPDVNQPLFEREIGGLGIHFVRSLMDDVRYRWQNGRNHVRLRKRIEDRP